MTESQPEGSETTKDAMEEDLIEESAFEVEETDRFIQRASAKSFTNVNKPKAPASQSKSNEKAKSEKVFLGNGESRSFVNFFKQFYFIFWNNFLK